MKIRTLNLSSGCSEPCLFSRTVQAADVLIAAMSTADHLAAVWDYPAGAEELMLAADVLGNRLLVSEPWQAMFPQAGVLIESSISGGDLRTRFSDAADAYPGRCWLLTERLCAAFPLPCPNGQGTRTEPPAETGFFAESLGCRYVHKPGQVILFDTDETLEKKRQWALDTGFLGWLQAD